ERLSSSPPGNLSPFKAYPREGRCGAGGSCSTPAVDAVARRVDRPILTPSAQRAVRRRTEERSSTQRTHAAKAGPREVELTVGRLVLLIVLLFSILSSPTALAKNEKPLVAVLPFQEALIDAPQNL